MDCTERTPTSLWTMATITSEVKRLLRTPARKGKLRGDDREGREERERLDLFLVLKALEGNFESLTSYIQTTFGENSRSHEATKARYILLKAGLRKAEEVLEHLHSHGRGSIGAIFCQQVLSFVPQFKTEGFGAVERQVRKFISGRGRRASKPTASLRPSVAETPRIASRQSGDTNSVSRQMPLSLEEKERRSSSGGGNLEEERVCTNPEGGHYWVIEAPDGPTSQGVCKHCGKQDEFRNSVYDSSWGRKSPR
ncbi:hypothetical protein IID24_02505 [Patescibacteria group bacterium]|nr:hypothetical protein [Patescibacteria group bacterium]